MNPTRPHGLSAALAVLVALALLVVAAPLPAQMPDRFTNLQVLPKDSTKEQVFATMRAITSGLGVRCTHCHVGPDNLQGMDFATDEKHEKKAARAMLRMVTAIERDYLAALPAHDGERQTVTCYTCHRGQSTPPQQLSALLARVAREEGAQAALARYQELKREHADDGAYDFREQTLFRVANELADGGKADDALAVLAGGLEIFPASVNLRIAQGRLLLGKGDKAAALGIFKRVLELDPANELAKRMVAELEAPAPP
jgi:tetratricopeptide (TPR) repeat protein